MSKKSNKHDNFAHAESEDHGEELWLVSYADMVTLLFGFFVILFSFSTIDDKKFDQMSEKVSEAFKNTDGKITAKEDSSVKGEARQLRAMQMLVTLLKLGDDIDSVVDKIEKNFSNEKQAATAKDVLLEKVAIENKDVGVVTSESKYADYHYVELVLPDETLFGSGKYRLSSEAVKKIGALASSLSQVPDVLEIEVVGHTDGQPPSHTQLIDDNFTLSSLRAGAVAAALIQFGVDPKKLSVRGLGNLKPILPERDDQGRLLLANRSKNRRVSILLKVRGADASLAH